MEMHLTSALSGNSFDDLIEVLCLYKCRLCHFAVSTGKADVIVHIKTEHQQMMLGHGPVNCFPAMNSFTRQPGNSGVSTLSEALRSRHLMLQKDGLQGTSAVSIGNDLPVRWTVPPVQLSQERPREAVSYVTPSFEHFSQASGPAAAQRTQQLSSVASSGRFARSGLSSTTSLGNNVGGDIGMTVKEEPMSEGDEDAERLDPTWGDSEGSTRIADDDGAKGTGQSSSGVKLKKTVSIVCPICNARLYRKTVDRHMDLHNDRGGFSCDGCDFETDQWHEMRSHMQRKHKPKQRCQNCDFETWSTEVFAEHMEVCVAEEEGDGSKGRRKSSGTRRESDSSMRGSHSQDVDKDEKSQEGVLEDEETAADEEFEICAECGEQLQGQDVTIHKELHNREGGFSCDKCEFKTESWPEIKDHLQENHKLKCLSCKYETLSESFLDKHVCKGAQTAMATNPEATADQVKGGANDEKNSTEKEPNIDQNVEGETVDNTDDTETCSVCNVEIKRHSLQRHKELHDSDGGFKCNQCDFSSATWEDIESHLASKHDSAYRCANCEFETSSEATLTEHFKSGSCTFSDRESEGDGRLLEEGEEVVDVSMEDDETQDLEADDFEKYKDKLTSSGHCCVCGVRLYRKSVQRHMQLHNDEGGFSCPRCDFTTDTWKEILKHVDWHERVRKKYTCPNCPYSSWAKTKMQVHLKRCHSGGNTKESPTHLVCPLCGVKLQPSALIAHMDSEHVLSTDKAIASPGKGDDKEASPFVQCPLCQIKVHRRMLRKHLDMPHVQWPKGAFAAPVSANPGTQGGSNVASATEIECPLCSKKIPSDSLRKHLDEPHPQWSQNPSNVSLQVNQGLMTIMPEKKDLQVQCPLCGMCMHRNMLTKHMKMPHVRWPQGTVSCTAEDSKGENSARETTLQGEGTVNNGLSSHGTASDQHDEVMVLSDDELEMDSDVFEEDDQQGSVGHCGICGEQVSDKSVERHMLLHDDKGGFSCDKCEFSTASWREMRTHIRNVHKEKLLCPECGFLATTIELLRAHVMNCREKTSAVCSICGQEVPGNQLQQHVKEAHSSVTNVMDIDLPSSLPAGKDDKNADVTQTVTQPGRGDSLIDSSPRMLPPKKRQSVAGAHDCPICGCHLYSKTVELHMRLHDAHGGFTCDLCNYITDEWRLMRTHYNSSHSGQRNWHAALKNDL